MQSFMVNPLVADIPVEQLLRDSCVLLLNIRHFAFDSFSTIFKQNLFLREVIAGRKGVQEGEVGKSSR